MLTLLREMSVRLLLRSPLRSALVLLGIALGVAIFVASEATSASLIASFEELAERVAGQTDLMVVGNESGIDGELVAQIAETPGVAHAAAAVEITTHMVGDAAPLLVMGVDFLGDTHFLPFEPQEGQQDLVEDPLAFVNNPTALLVTRRLAERKGLSVGDELELLTSDGEKTFTVEGILEDTGPAASFGGQVVVMFLDAAQVTFSRGHHVDRIDIALEEGVDKTRVQETLSALLAGSAQVVNPSWRGQRLRALTDPMRKSLQISGYLALIVGMFLIYNAIGVSVAQRRRELGVLRALGVLRRDVVLHFCLEATLLAIPGTALGLALSRYLLQLGHQQTLDVLSQSYTASAHVPTVTMEQATQGAFVGILMSLFAAYLPARRGSRMDPVEALRGGSAGAAPRVPAMPLLYAGVGLMVAAGLLAEIPATADRGLPILMAMAGGVMTAPALVLLLRQVLARPAELLFGISGRLGLDYVQRSLARSSINVLALWVAVAMSIAVGGWLNSLEIAIRNWFDQVTAAQLSVTAGSPMLNRRKVSLSPNALDKLSGLPGVEALQPIRLTEQSLGGLGGLALVASDIRTFIREARERGVGWEIVEGPEDLSGEAMVEAPRAILTQGAARRLNLSVGDSIEFHTPTGLHAFEIVAVVVDYSWERGSAFIDRSHYVRIFEDEAIDAINLYLEDDADPVAVADAARERLGGGEHLFVVSSGELREHFLGMISRAFAFTRSLELIVLLIALFGVMGTLVAAVLDRVREIGMLRAIGTSRRQLTSAIVVEASFLGLCAALGGIANGALLCKLFLETLALKQLGWHLAFEFPWEATMRMSMVVLATAALAGLLPGRRAASLEVRDAIAYE